MWTTEKLALAKPTNAIPGLSTVPAPAKPPNATTHKLKPGQGNHSRRRVMLPPKIDLGHRQRRAFNA